MNKNDIIIIGGGAAGLMAGIFASQKRKSVLLVEKNFKLGRKILVTGNGRCNVTNKFADRSHYHGGSTEFIEKVLANFNPRQVMKFFGHLGVLLREEDNGRIFPRTNQAETIVNALKEELNLPNVKIISGQPASLLTRTGNFFQVTLGNSEVFLADKLIIATGGCASEKYGASGDGYEWLKNFGHHITPLFPALVPLEIQERWLKNLQGLKVEAKISVLVDGKITAEKSGEVLFTHYGLSGPSVMALAGEIAPSLPGHAVKISLDLYPEETKINLDKKIEQIFFSNRKKTVKNALVGLAPANFIAVLLANINIKLEKKATEISKADRLKIVQGFKNTLLTVSGTRPFSEAQVTAGGVDTKEVNPETLESKIIPGLFLAGEILDVNGDSGGFNLQWAWASGYLAGKSAAK
ncbi:MAG: NAD(P)/FAD-dependent oxidoreductase [Patescibacteria group bacterium]